MKQDILTIGSATRDIFLESPLFKVVRDPVHLEKLGFPSGEAQCFALGSKVEMKELTPTIGGGATNAAVTFARQGFATASIFKIGRDRDGVAVVDDLKNEKVQAFPVYEKSVGTSYSAILLSPNGERTILNYRGASEHLKVPDLKLNRFHPQAVYIVPGNIPFPVIEKIVRYFKQQGAFLAMNPSRYYLDLGLKKLKPLLAAIDVILVNREEGSRLTGVSYSDEKGIFRAFDKLVPGLAVMTDGPKGVLVSDGQELYHAGIFKEKKMVDRTGAGDAFGSGFVAALLQKGKRRSFDVSTIEEAIRFGSANATSVVEYIGAQEGILTQNNYKKGSRWKELRVTARRL